MKRILIPTAAAVLLLASAVAAQPADRIRFNGQELFLNGGNVAWVNFAHDVGPGGTNFDAFEGMFRQVHESGGNAMRLWLHTTGAASPAWSGTTVTGPGEETIEDLRRILDLAWEHEIGVMICLWSFDMLRISNGTTITDRSYALLTDETKLQSYLDNALTPMVEALRGHPGILAWEIFNEPEGMSNEHGWSFNRHVPMSAIQRFVNRATGAIHRADSSALVTNGAWAFISLSDVQGPPAGKRAADLDAASLGRVRASLSAKYERPFTAAEAAAYYDGLASPAANRNYYTDERLVAAGGDADGTLDFYTVHYYEWAGTALSPFHHDYAHWGLDKPLVVAEFFLYESGDGNVNATYGVPWGDLYTTLFDRGYAGALAWQWYDWSADRIPERENWPRALANMQEIRSLHREAVDVHGPTLRVLSFSATPEAVAEGGSSELSWSVRGAASVRLDGEAVDTVGTRTVSPAETTTYTLVAADSAGTEVRREVTVEVRPAGIVRYELERARIAGDVSVASSQPGASAGAYLYMRDNGSITLDSVVVPEAAWYTLTFGYLLPFDSKWQAIEVNDVSMGELGFEGTVNQWRTVALEAPLQAGPNKVEILKSWGWMYFDYLEVSPTGRGVPVTGGPEPPGAVRLGENYPDPFNPRTVIPFSLPAATHVRLEVYDLTGRRVAVLVDGLRPAGEHAVPFDAAGLASGLYLYRLHAGAAVESRRMVLMR